MVLHEGISSLRDLMTICAIFYNSAIPSGLKAHKASYVVEVGLVSVTRHSCRSCPKLLTLHSLILQVLLLTWDFNSFFAPFARLAVNF